MATPVLQYQPVRDSYTFVPAYNTVESRLDGGRSRKRRDFLGGIHIITPTWILTGVQYTNFMGFFRERIIEGSGNFIGKFLSDVGVVCDHKCTLMGGMPKLTSQSGDAFFVSATLEVFPNPTRSFAIRFQNIAGTGTVIDLGTIDYPGYLSEFPIGRNALIAVSRQLVNGTTIVNLDGTYQIDTKPNASTVTLLNAASVNSDWTLLGTLSPAFTVGDIGAFILLPT